MPQEPPTKSLADLGRKVYKKLIYIFPHIQYKTNELSQNIIEYMKKIIN